MADAAWPDDALEVGRIADAWGIKGWLRVQPYAAEATALLAARRWFIQPPDNAAPLRPTARSAFPESLVIREARAHGDGVVASVSGIDDRTAAEALRGARIFVPRSGFPAAGADEFYWADLVGLDVVNREGAALGAVVGLIDNGPQSVLRVQAADADAEERLIPFVAAYIDAVDLVAKRITVDWGLDF